MVSCRHFFLVLWQDMTVPCCVPDVWILTIFAHFFRLPLYAMWLATPDSYASCVVYVSFSCFNRLFMLPRLNVLFGDRQFLLFLDLRCKLACYIIYSILFVCNIYFPFLYRLCSYRLINIVLILLLAYYQDRICVLSGVNHMALLLLMQWLSSVHAILSNTVQD